MLHQLLLIFSCIAMSHSYLQPQNPLFKSRTETLSLRLHPNEDIMGSLTTALQQSDFKALSIATAVGSVRSCWIRFANNSYLSFVQGPFEITSLVGTIDKNLQPHIHIQLADGTGRSIGGHLPSLDERTSKILVEKTQAGSTVSLNEWGCPIFTTLQLVLLHHMDVVYERKVDPQTTFHELYISKRRILH